MGKIINLIPNYNSCAFIKLCQIKAQKLSVICDSQIQFQPNFVFIDYIKNGYRKYTALFFIMDINYILLRRIKNLIEASHLIIRSLAKSFAQIKERTIFQ